MHETSKRQKTMRALRQRPFLLSVLGFLALTVSGFCSAAVNAQTSARFKLLSNETADRCIKQQDCLRDLFLEATLGDAAASNREAADAMFKWTDPGHLASITGDRLPADLLASIRATVKEVSLIAGAAGARIDLAKAGTGAVINLVILASDDFAKDRETSFKTLLSDVFAGQAAVYDDLAASEAPVCQSRLFVGPDAAIAGGLALAESDVEPSALQRCLHRLALNMLGLRHPLPDDVDSVLNPTSSRRAMTSIDFFLLKLLYDPMTKPGMTSAELTAAFPKLYEKVVGPSS